MHLNMFTSITKVTILIKKFDICNIPHDIYYEADTNFFNKGKLTKQDIYSATKLTILSFFIRRIGSHLASYIY